MSRRLWGVCASDQDIRSAALGPETLALRIVNDRKHPVGWGIGFYQGGEPLVRLCPLEDRDEVDLHEVVGETRSDVLIGHVRAPTVGALSTENTHPFRFRQWLMAHSGTIRQFAAIRPKMLDAMPSFLQRGLAGDTDSECLFHLALAFLHDSRELENPMIAASTIAESLAKAVLMVDQLEGRPGADEQSTFNVLMSDGNVLVALHRSPFALSTMTHEVTGPGGIRSRAVFVACEQTIVGDQWTLLRPQSTLTVERDLSVGTTEF